MINRRTGRSKERTAPLRCGGDAKANKLALAEDASAPVSDSTSIKLIETIFETVGFNRRVPKSRSPVLHTGSS